MFEIKLISEKDLADFVELWNQDYLLLTSSQFKLSLEKAQKGFAAQMFDYWGLYSQGKLVGFILLKKEDDLWIKHFLVDKSLRGQELGKMLLGKAEEEAKRVNKTLKAEILKDNETAKRFFEKYNFKVTFFNPSEDQYILEK